MIELSILILVYLEVDWYLKNESQRDWKVINEMKLKIKQLDK